MMHCMSRNLACKVCTLCCFIGVLIVVMSSTARNSVLTISNASNESTAKRIMQTVIDRNVSHILFTKDNITNVQIKMFNFGINVL